MLAAGAVVCHLEICATCPFFERLAVSGCLRPAQQQAADCCGDLQLCQFCTAQTRQPAQQNAQIQLIGTRETSLSMAEEVVVSKQLRVCVSMAAK